MSRIRKTVLEFLRHGPAHNQLLSPLTPYLALCGNYSGVTVRIPYEHAQFLERAQALNYELESGEDDASGQQRRRHTELQLQHSATEMARILAKIPGLISELNGAGDGETFTHLEIVLSASELALLPFELANAPHSFPGAGQPLALQSHSPLSITRRVRGVNNDRFRWPDRPRILFAHALPPADAARLVPAHLLALRNAVAPWIGLKPGEQLEPDRPPSFLGDFLTILPHASVQSLSAELRKHPYTHVHLLAHGVEIHEGADRRFGLALRDSESPLSEDRVSISRLVTAFRPIVVESHLPVAVPAVVTLASCHGAAGGSVVGAGSSVAHGLHEAGIPFVVASQFPLSFRASVLMVQTLYQQLLWGCDPRVLLCDLRRQLKQRLPHTHDWASVVAYASLPNDLETSMQVVRFEQAKRAIDAAFSLWDADAESQAGSPSRARPTGNADWRGETQERLELGKARLKRLDVEFENVERGRAQVNAEDRAQVLGRLASTEKRQAEIEFHCRTQDDTGSDRWRETLRKSCMYYHRAFCVARSQTWALAQEVALTLALDGSSAALPNQLMHKCHALACQLLDWDRLEADRLRRLWALGNLIELELASLWLVERFDETALDEASGQARARSETLAEEFQAVVGRDDWELVSHRRQLIRYIDWLYCNPEEHEASRATAGELQAWDRRVRQKICELCEFLLSRLPKH